ncbi:hypothetical protein IM660_10745 [Ruania alkalisoli]|uniref:Uncharacterized protein n=1 Tax=Ruania alkalisoli TaxID=2779775 RepID=A0A7M1SP37_9MICO|nr:hypothetical protein [Ruania alkalisoli]QOR69201.1 hypothetical protein IM660_10745 [Ruania alkalisoli]
MSEPPDDEGDQIVDASPKTILDVVAKALELPFSDEGSKWRIDGIDGQTMSTGHVLPLGATTDRAALAALTVPLAEAADRRWGPGRDFDAARYPPELLEEDRYDPRAMPAKVVRAVGAAHARWWRTGEFAVLLVDTSANAPDSTDSVAALVMLPWLRMDGPPADFVHWRRLQHGGEPTPWPVDLRFLSDDEDPALLGGDLLVGSDVVAAMVRREALLQVSGMIAWAAEQGGRAFGYWLGPERSLREEAPIVTFAGDRGFDVLLGRTLSEALCAWYAEEPSPDAGYARLARACRDLGVPVPDGMPRPPVKAAGPTPQDLLEKGEAAIGTEDVWERAAASPLLADLISRERARVLHAVWEIVATRDPAVLEPLAASLPAIGRATSGLDLGGALHANAGSLEHAVERLRLFRDGTCLCAAYTHRLPFYDPAKEAGRGHIRIEGEAPRKDWVPDRICACTACGRRFRVEQGEYHYTWWKWTSLPDRDEAAALEELHRVIHREGLPTPLIHNREGRLLNQDWVRYQNADMVVLHWAENGWEVYLQGERGTAYETTRRSVATMADGVTQVLHELRFLARLGT